ncbi:fungal specific transcription factor domain protein [Metarhizium robertsii]|uniref:Fungal specific transcription factor domain protein n=1 Tax=Metarhizium robertsii TaxID=568076 RepID=A0A0A1V8B7_9HYPO|nr:fungal specific transcription factor domain protein [Metarhizium robertsii]
MSAAPTSTSAPPPARKVKFVASDPSRGGLPVKRKQVQQACAACRRKKRRCIHADDAHAQEESTSEEHRGQDSSPSQASPSTGASVVTPRMRTAAVMHENGTVSNTSHTALALHTSQPPYSGHRASVAMPSQTDHLKQQSSRFVGDLNPEGMFLEVTDAVSAGASSQKGDVGIWLSSGAFGGTGQSSQFITSRPPPLMDHFLLPFVREHCLSCLPPPEDFARLKNVYIQKVHPIFPVIPIADIDNNLDHPCSIVLRQLVCLAAAADPELTEHYRLQNRGPGLLSPQDFSQALSSSVRAILETSLITDRVMHIQALIMLSLYTQPTCAEESDLPAQLGGRAIHHIQTLGLHLLRYDAPNCDDLENLFCCVWALDRINAAEYGRPCLIHERDIGADLEACIRKRPPCFRLFLSVIQWLDQVVELYRPGPSAEASGLEKIAYIDLPVLEAMIVDADALKVPSSLIATIETFYHAVIILSCRLARPGTVHAASTLPPPSANARRSLAAERIACAVPRDHLSPMPFIPYAVSLALSVEYRKMRHSRLAMFRARAMSSFKRNCEMLRKYGDHFWSANVVAGLGERVLKEMERAATSLTTKDAASPVPLDVGSRSTSAGVQSQSVRQTQMLPGNTAGITSAVGMDNAVDFSLIDPISGQDVFGHIDPSFNLEAVDDVLEANLDIGLPLNWGDWGQFAIN